MPSETTPLLESPRSRFRNMIDCVPTRWILTFFGFLGFFNVYALRVNLSVALVAMVNHTKDDNNGTEFYGCSDNASIPDQPTTGTGEFNWSTSQQSLILSSFFIGYFFTQIPGGRLAERFGAKWIYGVGILVTAVFSLLTPLAAHLGVGTFVTVRIIEGLFEGVTYPAMHVLISKWIPPNERSFKATIIYMGSPIGTVVSSIVSGILCDSSWGWPSVFYAFGTLSCVWFLLWAVFIFEEPSTHPWITKKEQVFIKENVEVNTMKQSAPWRVLLTSGPLWGVIIAHLGQNCGFYLLLMELPTYLGNILHYDIKKDGYTSSLPYLLQAIVGTVVGKVVDIMRERKILSITTLRKLCNSIGFLGPAVCLIGVSLVGCNDKASVALFCIGMALNGFVYSGYQVIHIDMAPNLAGTLLGITNMIATLGGIVAPLYVGWLTGEEQSLSRWAAVFYTAAAVYVVSNFAFVFLASAELQPWAEDTSNTEVLKPNHSVNTDISGDREAGRF